MALGDKLEQLQSGFMSKWNSVQKNLSGNMQMQSRIAMGSLDDAMRFHSEGAADKAKASLTKANAAITQLMSQMTDPNVAAMHGLLMGMFAKVAETLNAGAGGSSGIIPPQIMAADEPIYKRPIVWIVAAGLAIAVYFFTQRSKPVY